MNKGLQTGAGHLRAESPPLTIPVTGSVLFQHGLTGFVWVNVSLLCVVANNGYLPGEEIPVQYPLLRSNSTPTVPFLSWANLPGVVEVTRNTGTGDLWKKDATGFDTSFTSANWKIKVRVHG